MKVALDTNGPFYIRFGRYAVPVFNNPATYRFELGKGQTLLEGTDVTIVATGIMVAAALEAAKILAERGISARVINIHTIKPLDTDLIAKAAAETGAIVTAEEHNIIGASARPWPSASAKPAPSPFSASA